ncbi:sodium:calcium antiporter [Patescibacteria group bacterium]|nr:sodium:calcium antiporter [Patescibacteria group bacterium]
MIVLYLLLIALFSYLLIKATDILLVNIKALVEGTKIGKFAITGLFLAFATSLPELFVGITSALKQTPSLSLGNIVGANIANISFVIGGAALISGTVNVYGGFLAKDVFYAFIAGVAPFLLLYDKTLSRIDGVILILIYGFYQTSVLRGHSHVDPGPNQENFIHRIIRRINSLNNYSTKRELGWIFLGVAMLLLSSDIIVRLSIKMAVLLNVPILVIGLILISLGTTLPEFVFGIKAVKNRQAEMMFGNLLGSIVANSTLIIGIVALISPIEILAFNEYLLATLVFIILFAAFYFFIRSKRKLERWEGAVLVLIYLAFVLAEFLRP